MSPLLSFDALPPPDTVRWVASRKQAVVVAVRTGALTLAEACERYRLSTEEILSWDRLLDHGGARALRATKLHLYRFPVEFPRSDGL